MNQKLVIDVTKIEPRLKHPTIFSTFDTLAEGDTLLLHNDHDPKPLYYQLISEKGNCFSWIYKKTGPEIWEVEILKNSIENQPETIGEIAASDIRKAEIFKKLGLDFCCGGKTTLEQACKEKGLDIFAVKEKLKEAEKLSASISHLNFKSWTCTFLIDYIINVHHTYVLENIPMLTDLSIKVAEHHGKTNPELNTIQEKVSIMINELITHMKKEENVLFPFIKHLEKRNTEKLSNETDFGSIKSPISVMEQDHELVGKITEDFKTLTNNYTLPENACNSYALLYNKLQEFCNDLFTHIHLENNILFPKALKLENKN